MVILLSVLVELFKIFMNHDFTAGYAERQQAAWEAALEEDGLPTTWKPFQFREWFFFGFDGVSEEPLGGINYSVFGFPDPLWSFDEDWLCDLALPEGMTLDMFVKTDIKMFNLCPDLFYHFEGAIADLNKVIPEYLMEHYFSHRELVFGNELPLYNNIVAIRELRPGEFRIIRYWDSFNDIILSPEYQSFYFFQPMYNISSFQDLLFNDFLLLDASSSGQLGFQDPASPIAEGLIDLHHHIFLFLIIVIVFVYWMLIQIIIDFNEYRYEVPVYSDIQLKNSIFFNYVKVSHNTHGVILEIVWTLIPTFILMLIALPSFALLYAMDEVVDPELTIKVIGHQWYWSYEYSDFEFAGVDTSFDSYMVPSAELDKGAFRLLEVDNRIVLPVDTHIRVIITAGDVLHCWAVPSLAIKMDAVPGRLNQQNLYIKREGLFFGQCSELCGVNHGFMPIAVESVDRSTYLSWLLS